MAAMNAAQRTEVFIVDDLPAMRERLRELITDLDGVDIVGDAGTPDDAIAGIRRTNPDCVLLDYQLDGGTGVDVLRVMHPESPEIVFIVLTNHVTEQHRRTCLDAGARFFLDKSTEFGRIRSTIADIGSRAQ